MIKRPWRVLFLCTGNSARSILAEALLRHRGGGRFAAFSAGSRPVDLVNPLALDTLAEAGIPRDGLRSKSWDEFAGPDAPAIDAVITVCDNAAGEMCPIWPGQPLISHWGVEDPAAASGDDASRRAVFRRVFRILDHRVTLLTAVSVTDLTPDALAKRLRDIGTVLPPGIAP
jgi:arsenate reductase